jgi:selenium-binding protein 1
MIEDGLVPELMLGGKYGHHLHFWDLETGRHTQSVDLGAEHQMVLEIRASHDPDATWGCVGVVTPRRRPNRSPEAPRWWRSAATGVGSS